MAKRRWSPVPIRLVDDERFLDLSVHGSDLLLRLYSWGCDSHGRFPADKRALRRRTGIEYDTAKALSEIEAAGLAVLYGSMGRRFGILDQYDLDIPANLINKRGAAEYPDPPRNGLATTETHAKGPPRDPKGKTKGSLSHPLNIDLNLNNTKRENARARTRGERDVTILDSGSGPILPTIEMVREDCRDAAKGWLKELDLQRKTQRKGVRNRGVLAHCDTWETLATEFADHLARLADEAPPAFRSGVRSMIEGGKGWIMNPLKYLRGACRIAAEDGKKGKRRRTEKKIGPQADGVVVEAKAVEEYDRDTLEFLGVD